MTMVRLLPFLCGDRFRFAFGAMLRHDGPDETRQLSCYRDDSLLRSLVVGDRPIFLIKTMLSEHRMCDNLGGCCLLAFLERFASLRLARVLVGGFDQHAPAVGVAGLGDRPLPLCA